MRRDYFRGASVLGADPDVYSSSKHAPSGALAGFFQRVRDVSDVCRTAFDIAVFEQPA